MSLLKETTPNLLALALMITVLEQMSIASLLTSLPKGGLPLVFSEPDVVFLFITLPRGTEKQK